MATSQRTRTLIFAVAAALPLLGLPFLMLATPAAALPIAQPAAYHAASPPVLLRVKSFCRHICVRRICPSGSTHHGPHGFDLSECWFKSAHGNWHVVHNVPCAKWERICRDPGLTYRPRHIDRPPFGHSRIRYPLRGRPRHPAEPVHHGMHRPQSMMRATPTFTRHAGGMHSAIGPRRR